MRRRELWFAILAVASVIGVPVAVGWALGGDAATSVERSPITWSGPVRVVEGAPLLFAMEDAAPRTQGPAGDFALWGWEEPSADADIQWVDITGVAFQPGRLPSWFVDLAVYPPKTDTLDRDRTLISYGVVLDTDADGEANYELGMSNDAPRPGHLRKPSDSSELHRRSMRKPPRSRHTFPAF